MNETLSDSDSELVNGDEQTIKSEPVEERKQKENETDAEHPVVEAGMEEASVADDDENGFASLAPTEVGMLVAAAPPPAGEDPVDGMQNEAGVMEENPLGDSVEEDEQAAGGASVQDSGLESAHTPPALSDMAAVDISKGLPEQNLLTANHVAGFGGGSELGPSSEVDGGGNYDSAPSKSLDGQQPLTEEYLLTGPAHNLDDSQYKSDMVDATLDDIFKWSVI